MLPKMFSLSYYLNYFNITVLVFTKHIIFPFLIPVASIQFALSIGSKGKL